MELFQPLLFDEASLIGTGKEGRGKRSISFHLESWEYFGSGYKPRHITVLYFSVAKCYSLIRLWCDDALWRLPNMQAKRKVGALAQKKKIDQAREEEKRPLFIPVCTCRQKAAKKQSESRGSARGKVTFSFFLPRRSTWVSGAINLHGKKSLF